MKTVLIKQGCFSYCWTVLTQCQFLVSHISPPAKEMVRHQEMWGDTDRTADLKALKGYPIPHGIMVSKYNWQMKEEGQMLGVWPLSFQITVTCHGGPFSWEWLNACLLAHGNEFFVLLCLCAWLLLHLLKCFYLNPFFSNFYSTDFFLHPTVEGEQAVVWGWAASPELSQTQAGDKWSL